MKIFYITRAALATISVFIYAFSLIGHDDIPKTNRLIQLFLLFFLLMLIFLRLWLLIN